MAHELLLQNDRCYVATSGRVMVGHFLTTPTAVDMRELGDREGEWGRALGGKFAVITVLSPGMGMQLDKETRQVAADVLVENAPSMAANVLLIEQTGFIASITRSIVVSISMLSRTDSTKVVSTRDDAAERVANGLTEWGHPTTTAEVRAILEDVLTASPKESAAS